MMPLRRRSFALTVDNYVHILYTVNGTRSMSAMRNRVVRIDEDSYRKLDAIASRGAKSHREVLSEALEEYRRQLLLRKTNEAFAALRASENHWAQEQSERSEWEITIGDGQFEPVGGSVKRGISSSPALDPTDGPITAFVANCSEANWPACASATIFGIKRRKNGGKPNLSRGDIVLVRIARKGVKALWEFEDLGSVPPEKAPWPDGPYAWILHCRPVQVLNDPLWENFTKTSSEVERYGARVPSQMLAPSLVKLAPDQFRAYLSFILENRRGMMTKAQQSQLEKMRRQLGGPRE